MRISSQAYGEIEPLREDRWLLSTLTGGDEWNEKQRFNVLVLKRPVLRPLVATCQL